MGRFTTAATPAGAHEWIMSMEKLSEQQLRDLLSAIPDPHAETDLVSLGWVRGIGIDGNCVSVDLRSGYPLDGIRDSLLAHITQTLECDDRVDSAVVNLDLKVVPQLV
jgi:ATP-binding protein involved in chromosome partitioning